MASDEGEGEVWSSYHGGEDVLVEGGRHPQLVSLQKSRRNAKHPPWKRATVYLKRNHRSNLITAWKPWLPSPGRVSDERRFREMITMAACSQVKRHLNWAEFS